MLRHPDLPTDRRVGLSWLVTIIGRLEYVKQRYLLVDIRSDSIHFLLFGVNMGYILADVLR